MNQSKARSCLYLKDNDWTFVFSGICSFLRKIVISLKTWHLFPFQRNCFLFCINIQIFKLHRQKILCLTDWHYLWTIVQVVESKLAFTYCILSFASHLQWSYSLNLTCWNWKCNLPKITDEGFFVLTFYVGLILWACDLPHGETSKNYQLAILKTVISSWGLDPLNFTCSVKSNDHRGWE